MFSCSLSFSRFSEDLRGEHLCAGSKILGSMVALGEVVADVYLKETPSVVELLFTARPGGASANLAVAASRLGSRASLIGRVGRRLRRLYPAGSQG